MDEKRLEMPPVTSPERAAVPPPPVALLQLATGYMVSQAVYVAAKLGLADLVAAGPRQASELAKEVGANASALRRLLRMLAAFGVFSEDEHDRFYQSPMSALLQSHVPGSLRPAVIMWNEEQYRAWGHVLHSVRTGETAFNHVFGVGLFSYLAEHRDTAATFDAAMTNLTTPVAAAVVQTYDFSSCRTVVDIGGGQGILLRAILEAFPNVRGVLFDLPSVIANAERQMVEAGLRDRCDLIGGSFFETVPAGGDAYVLAQVLHNWDDEHSLAILKSCHRAMAPETKILVIEALVGSPFAALSDMHMLAVVGGRERTEDEYRGLFNAGGFRLTRIIPTGGPQSIVEGRRV
jgi:ubiquinone/menaquinone biosynthesis C-methylase UbiE